MKQATANCPAKACRGAKGDEIPDVRKLELAPMLKCGEPGISIVEALRRARANPMMNHGKRFAMKLADALNAGRVSEKVWPFYHHIIFGKGSRRHGGRFYAWGVFRRRGSFGCGYGCFADTVSSDSRLLRPRE